MVAVMRRLTIFNEKSNDPGPCGKAERERGIGAHWAWCGLALEGAKVERGFRTCIFRRRGYKIKRTNQNVLLHKNLHNGWIGVFFLSVDR